MIDSYADLVAAVLSYAHRADLQTECSDYFVPLANARIGRELRAASNLVALDFNPPALPADLPDDFAEIFSLEYFAVGGRVTLKSTTAHGINQYRSQGSPPAVYCITNRTIEWRPPTIGNTLLRYFTRPELSATVTSNQTLLEHPALYLYATLLELQIWAQDSEQVALVAEVFGGEVAAINRQFKRERYEAPAQVRI